MNRIAPALRIDRDTWRRLESEAGWTGSTLTVLGTYLAVAFSRFGWPDFDVRATTEVLLGGLAGWAWLSVASWLLARMVFDAEGSLPALVRLVGHAHLPLLVAGGFLWIVSFALDFPGIARWPALLAGLFWMPAMLTNAVAAAMGLSQRGAAPITAIAYSVWLGLVGVPLWQLLRHLL